MLVMQGISIQGGRGKMLAPKFSRTRLMVINGVMTKDDTIAVAGATGGAGQILVAKLLKRGHKVRAICRPRPELKREQCKDAPVLYPIDDPNLEVVCADMRYPDQAASALKDANIVCSAVGSTAFPSDRWKGDNGPDKTEGESLQNLIAAAPPNLKRFVMVTSIGIERRKFPPFAFLNLFKVLDYKSKAEEALSNSGIPYTILRPCRLTDGPYTSTDLNSLIKGTSGKNQEVQLSLEDQFTGEASRVHLAETILQALLNESTEGQRIAIMSVPGDGPGADDQLWSQKFEALASGS